MTKCQNKVKDQETENEIFFCITLKEYLNHCPKKCPYYVRGSNLSMDFIYHNNFEMECPNFLLITAVSSQDSKLFVCGLLGEDFNCESCPVRAKALNNEKNYIQIS